MPFLSKLENKEEMIQMEKVSLYGFLLSCPESKLVLAFSRSHPKKLRSEVENLLPKARFCRVGYLLQTIFGHDFKPLLMQCIFFCNFSKCIFFKNYCMARSYRPTWSQISSFMNIGQKMWLQYQIQKVF